jgi:hypothetical protein
MTNRHRRIPHSELEYPMKTTTRASALSLGLLLSVALSLAAASPASAAVTLTASPAGSGTTCSSTVPCTVVTALSKARAGDTVVLGAGSYGAPVITGTGGSVTYPIKVRPLTGAAVTFSKLQTYLPNATWTGITVTSILYVYPAAINTVIDGFSVTGAGSYLRANGTVVRNSLFEGGIGVDAVQIKNATGVRLEHNTIRNYAAAATGEVHVDCVQIFDAAQVTLVRNSISNCSNAGVTLSPGLGLGIQGVTLESNFIQGCVVITATCKGGAALDVREASATGVVVRNNTIVDGATRVVPRPGLVFDRNVIDFLADCTAPMTNTVVEAWNTGSCVTPSALGTSGNRQGAVAFVNQPTSDLHVTSVADATVVPSFALPSAVIGFDGFALRGTTAGADE